MNSLEESTMLLLVTRELIQRNASDAYTIVKHLDTPGHTACSGPHIKFHGLRVPEYHVLAGPGTMNAYRLVQAAFTMSAVIVGAMSVGIMRHAFETALDFAKSRTAGSTVLLLERQSVADSLIDIKMSVEAARCITWKAAHALEHMGEAENSYEAKIWCSEAAVEVVTKAMRVVGMCVLHRFSPSPLSTDPLLPDIFR